jgi:oligosaccharide translocation protein RFT1
MGDLTQPTVPNDSFSSTLLTGRSLFLLQLLTRLLTFTLNQSLVRIASPEVFGTAAIQFDLICSTVLFLSREGIRNALLRSDPSAQDEGADKTPQTAPLAGIPVWLGMVVSTVVTMLYLRGSPNSTTVQTDFHLSLGLYLLSSLLELLIEPLYIKALRSTPPQLRVRVQAEGGMAIVKAIVTFLSLLVNSDRPLLGFALGQVGGAAWLAGRYIWEYRVLRALVWESNIRYVGSDSQIDNS